MKNKTSSDDNIKLKISDIKKSSSSDVTKAIKRIKQDEKRMITGIVIGILLLFCVIGIIVFPVFKENNFEEISSGPLKISFTSTENGVSDVINFIENDNNNAIFNTKVVIRNDSGVKSWYAIYLDDYLDMIEYDKCSDRQIDKKDIYFSIDNSYKMQLDLVDYGGRYVLLEEEVLSDSENVHEIKVWYTGNSKKHYHGKISVKYLR